MVVAAFCFISVLVLVGGANAYYKSSGSGSGTSTVGTLVSVSLVALTGGQTPNSTLAPGRTADLVLSISNGNSFSAQLVSVVADGTPIADATHRSAGCTTTGVTVGTPTNLPIALGPGPNTVHLIAGAAMDGTSLSACQGATFAVPVTITVQK